MHTFPRSPFHIHRSNEALPFSTPAVYICNHTSLFDVLASVAYHPNVCIVAQDWVFASPFFGIVARCAGFIPVKTGIDDIIPLLRHEVEQGSSILIFPEGTRSRYGTLQRFHRGAFYIAEQLQMPMQPLLSVGTFRVMSKGEVFIGKTDITLTVLPPIMPDDHRFGNNYVSRTREVRQYYYRQLTKGHIGQYTKGEIPDK